MKHTLLCLLSTLSIIACIQPRQQPGTPASSEDSSILPALRDSITGEPEGNTIAAASIDSAMVARLNWIDSVAYVALQSSTNPLFQYELKDSSIIWHWDDLVVSDSAAYIALQVGHREDDDEFPHFATSGWLYVDTLSRDVYEYRVDIDSLIKLSTIAAQHVPDEADQLIQ